MVIKPQLYKQIKGPDWFHFANAYDRIYQELPELGNFVEIGAFLGKSTAYMAELIQNGHKISDFATIDLWQKTPEIEQYLIDSIYNQVEDIFPLFTKNMNDLDLMNYVVAFKGYSYKFNRYWFDNTVDAIFFDGDHSYEGLKKDLIAWLPKVKPGGILAGDDYNHVAFPGIKQCVHELFRDVEIIDCDTPQIDNHKIWFTYKKG